MADEIDSGVIPKNECFLEEFKEFSEILQIVLAVKDIVKHQVTLERSLERFTYVINQYQEQPHLLDPHLTTLLDELLKSIKSNIHNKLAVHLASKFIYILTKTRGYKVIACILPHEVSDLHVLLSLLSTENFQNSEAFECKYILLLWLSIVCIIPFDLSRFDGADDNTKSSTCDTIYSHGQEYLECNNRCQEIAALMMARFLSRPDVEPVKLDIFVDWALKSLSGDQSANGSISLTTGVLFSFSYLFKHGRREVMSRHAEKIFERIEESHLLANRNTNVRKLSIKVIQRIGLVFLKPRLASWRYKRGLRSLADNLRVNAAGDCHGFKGSSKVDDDDESEIHVPDIIEQVVEKLLVGLRDESTTIRWSSAKGVGRVTGRLPVDLADEVVASVLELFSPSETEDAWHGGCLCLGELGHRGLLLPDRLGEVIPLVEKSLVYDERRGTCSVGGNVRDSASFICWSLARAYDGIILRPFMDRLMRSLVLACLFDREIKARRAASAALQELVGRQGDIADGIDIITACDYFAVGQRNNCFLQLSMQISEYEGYKEPIIEHLMTKKLCHWDLTIRGLASEALGRLASKAVDYFVDSGLKVLLDLSISDDFSTRHGAVLALSHVLLTLAGIGKENQETDTISCLLTKLKERRYFKGIHGDMMRRAFCFFIRKLSQSKFKPNSWSLIDEWMEFLSECLHNPDKNVQNSSLEAMSDLLVSYRSENIPRIDNLMIECTRGLDNQSDYIRCAYSLLLGDIPLLGNKDHQDRALHLLCQHALFYPYLESHPSDLLTHIRPPLHSSTVEERRDAIRALSRFYQMTGVKEENGRSGDDDDLRKIYEVLFVSINDYTIDDRGDVGTGVRESVMSSLYDITHLVATTHPEVLTRQICERIFCNLVQQSTEKIDHTRSKAGEVFFNLLHHSPRIENIPEFERLRSTFPEEEARVVDWSSPSDTFPRFARLLTSDVYSYHLLLGTVISAGGLTEHLVKHSVTSLMNQLKVMTPHQVFQFGKTLVRIFNNHIKVDRVTMPMLKTLDKLLTNDCFSSLDSDRMTELAGDLVKVCTNEVNKSRDINKIIDSIEVFCCLLLASDAVRGKCLGQLMVYLCHRFPRIRKCCASRLYETLMVSFADDAENSLDEITDILMETDWDLPVEQLRPIRNNLCSILGVPVPVLIEKK